MAPEKNTGTPTNSEKKRREIRREEIIDAAIDIFYTEGYYKASLRDISEKMGLTKAAIYYHFPSKEDILFTIVDQANKELLFVLKSSISEDSNPVDNLRSLIVNQILYMQSNRKKVKVLVEDKRFLSGKLQNINREQERTTFYLFKSYIEKLQKEGKIRNFDVNTVTFGIFGMINWLDHWYNPNKKLSLEQIADQTVDMLFNGLLTEEAKMEI